MLLLAGTGLCCLLDVKSTSGFTKGDKTRGQEKGQGKEEPHFLLTFSSIGNSVLLC